MKVAVVSGSPRRESVTQHMMRFALERAAAGGADAAFVNLADGGVEPFRGHGAGYGERTLQAARDLTEADAWIVGTPIYNSFISAALKNLFEFLNYKETPGKAAGLAIMAAGDIGFIGVQTMLTQLMSYFGLVTNPKAVYMRADMVDGGRIADAGARDRLSEMVDGTLALAAKLGRA